LSPGTFPLVKPDALFERPGFLKTGSTFFYQRPSTTHRGAWKICGLESPKGTACAAHFLIDRTRCWSAISLWRWISERFYFFLGYLDGEGGACQFAFATLESPLTLGRSQDEFWCPGSGASAPAAIQCQRHAARRVLS